MVCWRLLNDNVDLNHRLSFLKRFFVFRSVNLVNVCYFVIEILFQTLVRVFHVIRRASVTGYFRQVSVEGE